MGKSFDGRRDARPTKKPPKVAFPREIGIKIKQRGGDGFSDGFSANFFWQIGRSPCVCEKGRKKPRIFTCIGTELRIGCQVANVAELDEEDAHCGATDFFQSFPIGKTSERGI